MSLRNLKKHWFDYSFSLAFPLEVSLIAQDYWCMLLIMCVGLFIPKLITLIPIYILLKTHRRVKKEEFEANPRELEQLVLFIQMNHLQSLTEAIESNPILLYGMYKKKTLLCWCKAYNNTKALMVIIQMTKKYPKQKAFVAA